MGLSLFKSCASVVYRDRIINLNPNPKNFKIEKLLELENTYAEIRYPDCTTFEGLKVMVFKGKVAEKLLAAKEIARILTRRAYRRWRDLSLQNTENG